MQRFKTIYSSLCGLALTTTLLLTGCAEKPSAQSEPLNTGRAISPNMRSSQDVGNWPMNLIASPDGKFVISTDMGGRQSLWAIQTSDGAGVSHVDFSNKPASAKSSPLPQGETATKADRTAAGTLKSNGLYYGLAFSKDRLLYAAQGAHDSVAVLSLTSDGQLKLLDQIPTRAKDFPAGLAIDDRGWLYVANNTSGEGDPTKLSGSVAIYDPSSKSELGRYTFSASHGGTSNFPYGIAVLADGSKTFLAAERDDCVYVLDTKNPPRPRLSATVPTGAHPVAVLLTHDRKRLFVANSLGDTISVIDTGNNKVVDTILMRPAMVRDLPGATPIALALSPDEKTLYVALADMNAIALVDVADSKVRGYVPAGWYPSGVAVSADGKNLFVSNAKGTSVRNPNSKPDPRDPGRKHGYVLSVIEGNVGMIEIPTGEELASATQEVLKNNRLDAPDRLAENPLAGIGRAAGKIQHIIYIIKENRTYDEVLGDMPQGNGDPSLVLFGRDVTPNQHAFADRFVLFDNLYCCGEVSGDGWVWSTQGMANAYVERNVPYNYSSRGRTFDFEGSNNGYPTGGLPAKNEKGEQFAKAPFLKNGVPAVPDVASTNRNLWDAAKEAGVSLRNYGFFLYSANGSDGLAGGPDNFPAAIGLQPPGHDLAGISDIDFRRFDLDYPDSDAPGAYFKQFGDEKCLYQEKSYGHANMPSRVSEWRREFEMMLAKKPDGSAAPALMMIRFPCDHTMGARAGKHTPRSYIADNDYAVGQVVDAVSHSPIWKSCAIFVIEDDAQNGADHVDCHRSTGYVVSPWIKANSVDHRFCNTDSILKTIELLLGLQPLSQYDALSDPILDWDTFPSNAEPFQAILPSRELIAELNPPANRVGENETRRKMVEQSAAMDFSHADAVPSRELNQIIWKTVKGLDAEMPEPRNATADDDDEDDAVKNHRAVQAAQ
jgi:YVTN family beta-propeller protein